MNWWAKALLQRALALTGPGRWINNDLLTLLNMRPVAAQVAPHWAFVHNSLSMLAEARHALRPGMRALELGTGKNLTAATLLALRGVAVVTVDVERDCQWRQVRATTAYLMENPQLLGATSRNLGRLRDLWSATNLNEYCERAGIGYIAPYDREALRNGEYGVFDVCLSHNVLEHVRCRELEQLVSSLYAATAAGGAGVHKIYVGDHFTTGFLADPRISYLNFRRFSPRCWDLFAGGSLSYVNRLMPSDYDGAFRRSGFRIECRGDRRWEGAELPIPLELIHPRFRDGYPEDDLWVRSTHYCVTRGR